MDGINTTQDRPKPVVGGGYVVGRRTAGGKLRLVTAPFEHGSFERALVEAQRLSKVTPGRTFVVLSEVTSLYEDKLP